MSFKATLSVEGGDEMNLLYCKYNTHRDTDRFGRPSMDLLIGKVRMIVESSDDRVLTSWAMEAFEKKKFKLYFYSRDSNTKMKEMSFENGYVVEFNEIFESTGENPMVMELIVSAETMTFENATVMLSNGWPTS